jgi:hypothetical protein
MVESVCHSNAIALSVMYLFKKFKGNLKGGRKALSKGDALSTEAVSKSSVQGVSVGDADITVLAALKDFQY